MAISGTPRHNTVNSTNFDRELHAISRASKLGPKVLAWKPGEQYPGIDLDSDGGKYDFAQWIMSELTTIHALLKSLAIQSSGEEIV
ncbi:MAG: hypothetical protein ABSB55_07330 [Acidimicrobiales bacterium]|jgi:hypothetical protein